MDPNMMNALYTYYTTRPEEEEPSELELLRDAVDEVKTAVETADGTLEDIGEKVDVVSKKIDGLRDAFVSQTRTQAIQFALDHVKLGQFTYHYVVEDEDEDVGRCAMVVGHRVSEDVMGSGE